MSEELRALLRSAPELIKHEGCITMWRTRGSYCTPGEGLTAREIATPAFARAMALIASDITDYTTRTLRQHIGPHNTIDALDRWTRTIRKHLTEHDIPPANPPPPPEPGAQHRTTQPCNPKGRKTLQTKVPLRELGRSGGVQQRPVWLAGVQQSPDPVVREVCEEPV